MSYSFLGRSPFFLKSILLLSLTLFVSAEALAKSSVVLRSDLFIEQSSCGHTRKSKHNVIRADFDLSQKLNPELFYQFEFSDLKSGFKQKIILHNNIYNYGPIFDGGDHFEYNSPECDTKSCQLRFFIYVKDYSFKSDINLQVRISEPSSGLSNEISFPVLKNKFSELNKIQSIELNPTFDAKTSSLITALSQKDIQILKKNRVSKVDLAAVVRTDLKQQIYTEQSYSFDLALKKPDVGFTYKVDDPTYLSAMLMYEVKDFSFETKTVIKNLNSDFFKCAN